MRICGGADPDAAGRGWRWLPLALMLLAGPAAAGLPPLTAAPGDPSRGRAIVLDRQKGLCLLCHSGPFPEERFQGDLAPSLAGTGARLPAGDIRARLVDARQANPATIMPAYHVTAGLKAVAPAFRDRPILTAQEIEDVVAFLVTLGD